MSIKLKLIGSFIGLALLALSIGSVALFDSYSSAALDQSRHHLKVISQLADFNNLTADKIPHSLIIGKRRVDGNIMNIHNPANIHLQAIKINNDVQIIDNQVYVWSNIEIPNSPEHYIILAPVNHQSFESFLNHYGPELSIFALIVIWSTFWVALVVSSLISKVDKQKSLLESQHKKAIDESKAKSQFLAHISHEIRTPLSAVIGYSETLLHSDQPMVERLGFINTIIRNGNHILNLVNDLLDLSKIEAEKLEMEYIDVNLISLLQDIEKLFQQQCISKSIEFKIHYNFPLVETITSDPVRLKQILINLCSNAIKFTKSGYVYLAVQITTDNQLQFMIEDSGIGMTKEQLSRIFSAYSQADSSTTRKFGGTGLGLSLSKHLAIKLGGDIEVYSQAGRGSTFTLTIDIGDISSSRMISDISQHISPDTTLDSVSTHAHLAGKVLLAEDNQDNQNLFSIYLRKFGIEPDVAHNGQQAVELALSNEYNLIFMDMQMPIMDGIEATTSLRNKGIEIPIVALTANAMKDDMDRFYDAGCNDFLTKPLKRDRLLKTCSKYLNTVDHNLIEEPIVSTILEEEPDLIDLISRFSKKLPDTIQQLRSLQSEGNYDELTKQTHDLKGVSGNMGYMEVSQLAGRLEFQIANKDNKEISYLLDKLDSLHVRIQLGLVETDA
ncbi:MAG: ATP-binding protein [Gammaproteobacteria bacterium]|nr:ATP-binding protein [Gammaproteobacteria bacterium]